MKNVLSLILTPVLLITFTNLNAIERIKKGDSARASNLSDVTQENETDSNEFPVWKVEHEGSAVEAYFSPDCSSIICNAKLDTDKNYQVYTMDFTGANMLKINEIGKDACSYFFPDGKRLIWTSTRDNIDLPEGNYSNPQDYPQGAELYISNIEGDSVNRITYNSYYDAEVSVSPDGQWILFARQIDGKSDLWRMKSDGTEEQQVTFTEDLQEGGAFYLTDSETILFRAWNRQDEGQRGIPMNIYTIKHDGTGLKKYTDDGGTNWSPYPALDGEHFVFVKVLPPHNYEIFMMSLITGQSRRLTYNDAFDGFPTLSSDGTTMIFTSSRCNDPNKPRKHGEGRLCLYMMDLTSLNLNKN